MASLGARACRKKSKNESFPEDYHILLGAKLPAPAAAEPARGLQRQCAPLLYDLIMKHSITRGVVETTLKYAVLDTCTDTCKRLTVHVLLPVKVAVQLCFRCMRQQITYPTTLVQHNDSRLCLAKV